MKGQSVAAIFPTGAGKSLCYQLPAILLPEMTLFLRPGWIQLLKKKNTITKQVIDDMCRKLNVPRENVTITGFYRENLFLQITPVNESEKNQELIQRINESPKAPMFTLHCRKLPKKLRKCFV